MDTVGRFEGTRAADFVLAAAGPVSLDRLVGWEIVRPTDLWLWLNHSRAQGRVAEDLLAGAGFFSFADPAGQAEVVAAAAPADWKWLFAQDDLTVSVLANARRASQEHRLDLAAGLFAGIVLHSQPETLPGGLEGWSELVVECVRRHRFARWLQDDVLERAISIAVGCGNLASQAILWGARGFCAMRGHRAAEGRDCLERALDTAHAVNNRGVSFEVHLQVAYAQVLEGLALEAVATFERFLGDVPEEILPLPPELTPPLDPFPETALAILGTTYGQVGQYGRGLDLLHRLRTAGTRTARPELVGLADAFLSGLHTGRREAELAREYAEPAVRFWSANAGGAYFLWHASISLAWARMTEGRLLDARDVLVVGQQARVASGLMYFAGSALFEVLERFHLEGIEPPPGLELHSEIERMLAWPDGYMRAVANRFRARHLARQTADGRADASLRARIAFHHPEAVTILRQSRAAALELARTLDQAAQWAASRDRLDEAARLDSEARRILAAVDLGSPSGGALDLATALLELGRLATHADSGEGAWGEIAARLCATLGAERCALFDAAGDGVRTLATRGGGRAWVAAMESVVGENRPSQAIGLLPPALDEDPRGPASSGQLLIVPFTSSRLGRCGWAVLENRYSRALISLGDQRALDVLGVQLAVISENLAIWRELIDTRQRLEHENRYYRQASPAPASGGRIVGDSPALRRTLDLVARVAETTTTVLIQGETGVGKELIAREIHRLSPRHAGPFIAVHIASFAPGLVASSLFGHERGAFTGAVEQTRGRFELADRGTLFLDEVGELTLEDQVRLLRVLQEGTFERVGGTRPLKSDFRLVAATNRDLAAAVRQARFREDVFFRLAAFPIEVPPLRDRREEIPTLALYFMEAANRKLARRFEGISEADMARLVAYRWPGNVRELEHVIERGAIMSEPPRLRIPPLHDAFEPEVSSLPAAFRGSLEDTEREYFRQLIQRTRGRVSGLGGAAEIAGLKPSTLNWHVDRLGLRPELQRARLDREGGSVAGA